MNFKLSLAALLLVLAVPSSLPAASVGKRKMNNEELEREYTSVRKIALKDPKVIWAFDRANKRLNERIIEIDPALAAIVNAPAAPARNIAATSPKPAAPKTVRRKPAATKAASRDSANTHTVKKGETLTAIAGSNKITVSELEKANGLTDESKLKVGQKLTIPTSAPAVSTTPSPAEPAKPKKEESAWDRLKSLYP